MRLLSFSSVLLLGFPLLAGAQTPDPPADVPAPLQVRPQDRLLFKNRGAGDQVYTCKAGPEGNWAWTLKFPDARLTGEDGEPAGRHFAGPTWQAKDGSTVVARPLASAPSPYQTAIPWLLLRVVSHGGKGTMTGIARVQRLHTEGGKAPAAGCDEAHNGAETRVPYAADYYFYAGPDDSQ